MRNKAFWIAILIIITAMLAVGWTQSSRGSDKTGWEYTSYQASPAGPSDLEMNKLGSDGWELVAIDSPGDGRTPRYVFKRKK
jgi:hypothetical protein